MVCWLSNECCHHGSEDLCSWGRLKLIVSKCFSDHRAMCCSEHLQSRASLLQLFYHRVAACRLVHSRVLATYSLTIPASDPSYRPSCHYWIGFCCCFLFLHPFSKFLFSSFFSPPSWLFLLCNSVFFWAAWILYLLPISERVPILLAGNEAIT